MRQRDSRSLPGHGTQTHAWLRLSFHWWIFACRIPTWFFGTLETGTTVSLRNLGQGWLENPQLLFRQFGPGRPGGIRPLLERATGCARYWLVGSALAVMIFTHLVLHHRHYYLMFSPAIAMLCAQAVVDFEDCVVQHFPARRYLWVGAVTILLSLSLVQGLLGMKIVEEYDPYPLRIEALIQKHTNESDRLLMENGGWGGLQFLLTNRKGLSIWDTKFLENPANLARIRTRL